MGRATRFAAIGDLHLVRIDVEWWAKLSERQLSVSPYYKLRHLTTLQAMSNAPTTPATLQQLARDIADHGGRAALTALTRAGRVDWDYAELGRRVDGFARRLLGQGVSSGDRVAILAPNQLGWFAACLGTLRAGGVVVPLDTQFADDVLLHILNDCTPAAVVTTRDLAVGVEHLDLAAPPATVLLDGDGEGDDGVPPGDAANGSLERIPAANPSDTSVIFYTSGTTGPPKGVPLSHANLVHQLEVLASMDFVSKDDRAMLPLPLHHVYPFALGMLLPFTLGAALILPALLTGPELVRAVRDGEATVIIGVPRLYRSLYEGILGHVTDLHFPQRQLIRGLMHLSYRLRRVFGWCCGRILLKPLHARFGPRLRMVASGGSALDAELGLRLEGLGWRVAVGYGLTETAPLLTLNPPGRARLTSVGKPIEGVALRIAGAQEDGGESSDGEVLARGPNVFSGYLHLPDKSAEAFTGDGWFKTGDRGHFDADGYLVLTGRTSTLIVTEGGENIAPETLEEVYARHPLIREIGILQREAGLVAVIVPEMHELGAETESNVRELIRRAVAEQARQLPSYQRLSDFVISREALARTRLGKVQRHKLEEHCDRVRQGEAGTPEEQEPMDVGEMSADDQSLLESDAARRTWDWLCTRYSDKRLTPDTNLMLDLGIDSLAWVSLSLELRERTGIELTEAAISRVESVRDLLETVAEGEEGEDGAAPQQTVDPLESPEDVLSGEDLRWIAPYGFARRLAGRVGYIVMHSVLRICFRIRAEGLDRLPDSGAYLLAPTHRSYLDAPVLGDVLGYRRLTQMHWAGGAHIMLSNPFMRFVTRTAHVAPINPRRAALSSLAFGAVILQRGHPLVWFPEGRLSQSGRLQRFQPGAGMLADRCEVPVVPVLIDGTYDALPPGRAWPRPVRIRVCFGEPVDPGQIRGEHDGESSHRRITEALRERLQAMEGTS